MMYVLMIELEKAHYHYVSKRFYTCKVNHKQGLTLRHKRN